MINNLVIPNGSAVFPHSYVGVHVLTQETRSSVGSLQRPLAAETAEARPARPQCLAASSLALSSSDIAATILTGLSKSCIVHGSDPVLQVPPRDVQRLPPNEGNTVTCAVICPQPLSLMPSRLEGCALTLALLA